MQTSLPDHYRKTVEGSRADEILRSCVHCGFCNATCPTYQLLGDELDGPRGRIYLIKDMLEQQSVEPLAVTHLDRCLTCRACETTCPSGVAYGELLEIGRNYQEQHRRRSWLERLQRSWLVRVVPDARAFRRWLVLGRLARPFLSRRLARQIPAVARRLHNGPQSSAAGPAAGVRRRILLLDGCVQQVSTPGVNEALVSLLHALRIEVVRLPAESCCGGLALHLGQESRALQAMTGNLTALLPELDGVDAVISTASGCGVTLKDYGRLLRGTPEADRATTFAAKVQDVGEFLWALVTEYDLALERASDAQRIALHTPCTLQHGQRCGEYPRLLLERAGFELLEVADAHLCCGSAGSYALLEPVLSEQLGNAKVAALTRQRPQLIATANVGCQLHLGGLAEIPVVHWVTLLQAVVAEQT